MPSIIIPARNSFEATSLCLNSVLYSVSRLNLKCEFVLVDDSSDPAERITDAFLRHREAARGHEVRIIRSTTHQHYTGVFSVGLHFASRDVVFFISNDMVVPPSFLQALLLVASLSRDFGIVRGTSNYTDSHPEHLVEPQTRPRDFREVDVFSQNVFGARGGAWVEDNLLSGDAILLKRELIDKIGGLDLRFFGYFGDIDYGMRAQLAGFRLVCAKGAWLFHEGSGHVKQEMLRSGMSLETARSQRMALVEKAYQQFRAKWHLERPETWDGGIHAGSVDFMALARANAATVPMKVPFPPELLGTLEVL